MRKFLAAFGFLLFFANAANAQLCNDPSGFLKTDGPITLGNYLVLGPDCQHAKDGGGVPSTNLPFKSPTDYGAACDGVTDDQVAIQAWLDAIKNYGALGWGLTGRTCIYSGLIAIRSFTIIRGNYMTFKLKASSGGNTGFNPNDLALPCCNQTSGASSIYIDTLIIDGSRATQTQTQGSAACLYIISSSRITVRDTLVKDCRGDGTYFGGDTGLGGVSTFILFDNLEVRNSWRNNLSIVGADRWEVRGGIYNSATNLTNDGPQCGIDAEPNGATTPNSNGVIQNVSASGNGGTLTTTGGSGICVFNSAANSTGIVIENVTAIGNKSFGVQVAAGMLPGSVLLKRVQGSGNCTGGVTNCGAGPPSITLYNWSNVKDFQPMTLTVTTAGNCNTAGGCPLLPAGP